MYDGWLLNYITLRQYKYIVYVKKKIVKKLKIKCFKMKKKMIDESIEPWICFVLCAFKTLETKYNFCASVLSISIHHEFFSSKLLLNMFVSNSFMEKSFRSCNLKKICMSKTLIIHALVMVTNSILSQIPIENKFV